MYPLQELHGRIHEFSSRLADIEKNHPSSDQSGTDDTFYEDEHAVIANLTTSLAATDSFVQNGGETSTPAGPRSPAQIVTMMDSVQKEELDTIMRHLENENRYDSLLLPAIIHDCWLLSGAF